MQPTLKRLYEITLVSNGKYLYFGITNDEVQAQQEYEALKKLNTEDTVGLYSHEVSMTTEFKYVYRLI